VLVKLDTKITIDSEVTKAPNLCSRFPAKDLETIGCWVWDGYTADKTSRHKWEARTEAAMNLAMQIQEDKNFPWPGCSNVIFPLVTIAALQFSSRSYGNIIQGTDVVKYRVTGSDNDGKLKARSLRIGKHMSYQVLEEDTCWEEQHDRLLINLGIVGCNFIKSYFSPSQSHNVSELVMARDLVIDYWAKSVETAPRKTHVIRLSRNDIYERIMKKTFKDVRNEAWFNSLPATTGTQPLAQQDNRKGLVPPPPDRDTPFQFLEQHRYLDLDQDGYAEPYIVTVEEQSKCVVKIAARWERDEDIEREDGTDSIIRIRSMEYFTKFGFIPAPDGGIYDIGFGTLLGPLNESVNSGINQLLDAGTMANSNGGFLGRGVKIRGGNYSFAPFEWKRVDSTGDDLRKSMVPFEVREPSNVMFQLLGLLIEYTDRIAGTTDPMVGQNPGQNTPAETSRNTMEQGMKVYSGIFKRVWRSMKEEFKKLHGLNGLYLPQKTRFGNAGDFITQEDYKSNPDLVVPVADPNVVSDGMRLTQAAAVRQAAHEVNGYNQEMVEKNYLRALKVDEIDTFYPGPDKVPPLPNFKVQVEQMKAEVQGKKIEFEKMKFMGELLEQRKLNQAQINKLNAEIVVLLAGAQVEQAKLKIQAFEMIVDTLKTHNEMLNNSISTLGAIQGDQQGDKQDQQGDKRGGMEQLAAGAGDPNAQGVPPAQPAGAPGPVG
jgi:chaperonin GroES